MDDEMTFRAVDFARFHGIGFMEAVTLVQSFYGHDCAVRWSSSGPILPTEVREAIGSYLDSIERYTHGVDSMSEYVELPQMLIGRAVLRSLGLPVDGQRLVESELPDAPQDHRYTKVQIQPELRWRVFERDDFRCQECGSRQFLEADHVVPESRGGPTTIENLQTLCRGCNRKKGATVQVVPA